MAFMAVGGHANVFTTYMQNFHPDRVRHVIACPPCHAVARTMIATEAMGEVITRMFDQADDESLAFSGIKWFHLGHPDQDDQGEPGHSGSCGHCGESSPDVTDDAPPASTDSDEPAPTEADARAKHPAGSSL